MDVFATSKARANGNEAGNLSFMPLVSCIMPTCNRRQFVPDAIRYFLRQDYPNKELLIVDDGSDCIADLVPQQEQIRYIRLHQRMKLGEKRNFCVRQSKGDYIMHWDDDDWMAPWRIRYQMQELLASNNRVCGLREMLFCEKTTGKCWLYKYPPNAKPWLAGGSLLYTRDFWKKKPFPDMQVASDTQFIFSRNSEPFTVLEDYHFYVATVHPNNTSPKNSNNSWWRPIQPELVRELMSLEWHCPSKLANPIVNGEAIRINKKERRPEKEKVTACLLAYKRHDNMQPIVRSLQQYDFIDEILVWNNLAGKPLNLEGTKVRVINSDENRLCYGRFLCARQAKNEIIYVQDDDVIVENIPSLFQAFLDDPSGVVHALNTNHYQQRHKYVHFYGQGALVGWGAFFKKTWLNVLDEFLSENPANYLFHREADQLFTILTGLPHRPLPASIQLLSHNSTPGIALYREPEHNLHKALAISQALRFRREHKNHRFPVTWNVVIPCKNYGKYLEAAVHSVLLNAADYVITIVDDHSTDNTEEMGRRYAQSYPFIHYIRLEESKEVSYARNKGIAAVESLFVVLLDADDKIGPDYLSQAEALLRQGFDVANPDALLFGESNARWEVPERVTLPMLLEKNYVHTCAGFRRSYWAQVGGIDERLRNWQDYDFWIRLAEAGVRIRKLPGDHFFYRKHGTSKSTAAAAAANRTALSDRIKNKHKHLFIPANGFS